MYFDTHAHYDDSRFNDDRHELIQSLPSAGVSLIMNASANLESSFASAALAEQYPFIYASAGIHPHDALTLDDDALSKLQGLLRHPKVLAVGEIGLDYHYDFSPRDVQKKALYAQLELANSTGLPVVFHDREAHEDSMRAVRDFKNVRGVFHCYSGSLEMAHELLRLGWSISFTGSITFKNAKKAPQIVAAIPDDRIMIETDSPYLTPVPHRGMRNDSSYLSYIASAVAAFRNISLVDAAALTMRNALSFFGISD